jgi:error-prone DNA polymerase
MGFYSSYTLIEDAKRHGVRVLPIDLQKSVWNSSLSDGAVLLGFCLVRGMNQADFDRIQAARDEASFSGLADFVIRSKVPRDLLEVLAMGDSFRVFGYSQREALWASLAVNSGPWMRADAEVGLFPDLSDADAIREQVRSFRLSTLGHPMGVIRKKLPSKYLPSQQIKSKSRNGVWVEVIGLVAVRQRPPTAKGTCFITLEDEEGFLDLVLHKDVFERSRGVLEDFRFVWVRGKIQKEQEAVTLIVSELGPANVVGTDNASYAPRVG